MWKWAGRALLWAVVVIAVLATGAYGYRAYRQNENARAIAIDTPNGIQEGLFVAVNGTQQWISIRGEDRNNPVLLMIDGGPGAASSVFQPYRWEKEFTIVEWDQPGAGKTFSRNGGTIGAEVTIESIARDGTEIAAFVTKHLTKQKIGLFASSWGTTIGVHMIKLRPDLFYAYVGTGQSVNMQMAEALNYEHVLAKARARNDATAIAELTAIGAPPYSSEGEFRTQRKWAAAYESGGVSNSAIIWSLLYAPGYTLADLQSWSSGFLASQEHFFGKTMQGPGMSVDLPSLGTDFAVPFFIFQGTADDYTPFELAMDYFDSVTAPQKAFVAAEGAGHYASFSHAHEMTKLLIETVWPIATGASKPVVEPTSATPAP